MQTAKDFGYRKLKTYQLARTLAAIVHTITLSRPGLPREPSVALRRSSKLLSREIIQSYRRQVRGDKNPYASARASNVTAEILSLIQSPDLFPRGAEKDRSYLLNSYLNVLETLRREESGRSPTSPLLPSAKTSINSSALESEGLEEKVILITRATSQSHSLVEGISLQGGLPVVFPMIEFTAPESWEPVDRAIINLPGYEGVVFTSQNAVERFLQRIDVINKSARSVLASRQISAVGHKTRAALEWAEIPVTLIPEQFSAKGLIATLQQGPIRGKRFLFPRGDLAGAEIAEALRGCDAVVDEVVVYRTTKPRNQELEPLRQGLRNKEIDAITFFSPSSVHNFLESVPADLVGEAAVACIGPSTTREAKAAGFRFVISAREATVESMVRTLIGHFESRQPLHPAEGSDDGE